MANIIRICALLSTLAGFCWAQSREPKILTSNNNTGNAPRASNSLENVIKTLRNALLDRYQRGPILVIQDTDPTILIGAQVLWERVLREGPIGRDLIILPYNNTGSGPLLRTRKSNLFLKMLSQLGTDEMFLNNSKSASLVALFRGLESISFDGSAIMVAGRTSDVEFLAVNISTRLTTKRIKLHLLWIGVENGDERILRELSERSGGIYLHADPTAIRLKYHLMELNETLPTSQVQNNVLLAFRRDLFKDMELAFLVDSSISILHIQIVGQIKSARLMDPQGTWIDLQVEPRFGVDEKLVGGGEIPGEWNLKITREAQMGSPTTSYHVAIQGESELRVQATKRTSQNNKTGDVDIKVFPNNTSTKWTDFVFLDKFGELVPPNNERMDSNFEIKDNENQQSNIEEPFYIQVKGTMDNGEPFSRVAWVSDEKYNDPKLKQFIEDIEPVAAWITSSSQLNGLPGAQGRITIEVRNNRNIAIQYLFFVSDTKNFLTDIIPTQTLMGPWQITLVEVRYKIDERAFIGEEDEILFVLQGPDGALERKAILRIQSTEDDKEPPRLTYKTKSNCNRDEDSSACHNRYWSADITIKDDKSGLLQIVAEPSGLLFLEPFIAGTRSQIEATYSASCCQNKLLLKAFDVGGNSISYTISSTDGILSVGEIAAIALGILLFLAILITIIACIVICRRRRTLQIKQVAT